MKDVDMLFVVDSSGSIGYENFQKIKQFLVDIADTLSNNSRIAVLRFSNAADTVISFGDYKNKNDWKGMSVLCLC